MAVILNIINKVLSSNIEEFTDSERHQTKSDKISQLIIKTVISQFLNIAILYSIIYLMVPKNPI